MKADGWEKHSDTDLKTTKTLSLIETTEKKLHGCETADEQFPDRSVISSSWS